MQKLTLFHRAVPLLRVRSLESGTRFYCNMLGFRLDWQEGDVASITRDECTIFLTDEGSESSGARVSVVVDDVQGLFDEITLKGGHVHPPMVLPRAVVLEVPDLDGNIIRFASSRSPA